MSSPGPLDRDRSRRTSSRLRGVFTFVAYGRRYLRPALSPTKLFVRRPRGRRLPSWTRPVALEEARAVADRRQPANPGIREDVPTSPVQIAAKRTCSSRKSCPTTTRPTSGTWLGPFSCGRASTSGRHEGASAPPPEIRGLTFHATRLMFRPSRASRAKFADQKQPSLPPVP